MTRPRPHPGAHILLELGFDVRKVGDEIHGSAPIVPELWVPGTASVRTSVLAAWADTATGYLAVGVGTASFVAVPDPGVVVDIDVTDLDGLSAATGPLLLPLAERARCERQAPGRAVLARSEDGLNAVGSVNGGLVALAVEEAALSATPGTLASLSLHYLRPVRTGPAVATATVRSGLGQVEVRDAGRDDLLAIVATTRTFP